MRWFGAGEVLLVTVVSDVVSVDGGCADSDGCDVVDVGDGDGVVGDARGSV